MDSDVPGEVDPSAPTFSLRPATIDDLPAVITIERKCYSLPWTEDAFKAELEKPYSNFLVFSDDQSDEVIAAYIVFWIGFGDAHILNIAVDHEWRGLGFAKKLVQRAVIDSLRAGYKRIFLEVRKSNEAAVSLYQNAGFCIDHIKTRFYEDGEDAYFMVLNLEGSNKI